MNRFEDVTKEWINSIPKTINNNGCWIPLKGLHSSGYARIEISTIRYMLHRLSMCVFYNLSYFDQKLDTRHSKDCDKACFNPEHLQPGTTGDNNRDTVLHRTHINIKKENCPKCGGEYKERIIRSGPRRGQHFRECPRCVNIRQRLRRKRLSNE